MTLQSDDSYECVACNATLAAPTDIEELGDPPMCHQCEKDKLRQDIEDMRARKDAAYEERNRVVAALCRVALMKGWHTGIGRHDPADTSWDREWMTIIYIDLPTGQVSWHIHDSQRDLFSFLPVYCGKWDGHDTPEKYRRVLDFCTGIWMRWGKR